MRGEQRAASFYQEMYRRPMSQQTEKWVAEKWKDVESHEKKMTECARSAVVLDRGDIELQHVDI